MSDLKHLQRIMFERDTARHILITELLIIGVKDSPTLLPTHQSFDRSKRISDIEVCGAPQNDARTQFYPPVDFSMHFGPPELPAC